MSMLTVSGWLVWAGLAPRTSIARWSACDRETGLHECFLCDCWICVRKRRLQTPNMAVPWIMLESRYRRCSRFIAWTQRAGAFMSILRVALYVAQMTSLSKLHRRLHVCACVQVGRRNPNCTRASFFLSVRVCVCFVDVWWCRNWFGLCWVALPSDALRWEQMEPGSSPFAKALFVERAPKKPSRNPTFGNCVFVEFPL